MGGFDIADFFFLLGTISKTFVQKKHSQFLSGPAHVCVC